jgi:hypothetical protein
MLTMNTSRLLEDDMLKRLWQGSIPLTATGLLMLAAFAGTLVGLAVDPRIITGAPAWLKPAKFAVSIAIYVFTLAWIFTLIPGWVKTRAIVGWTTAIALVLELVIIDVQAWRGTTSHFNVGTSFDLVLWTVMGIAIVVQTVTSIAVAVALWRQPFADRALGWALRLGMTITIIGAFSGGVMTQPTGIQLADAHAGQRMTVAGAHTVGAPDDERGARIAGTGWSAAHGDLRVPHFVGLHSLQALALIALALTPKKFSGSTRVRLTLSAAASYFALFGILLWQALRGQSVLAPDALTIATLGVWASITAAAAWMSLVRPAPIRTPVVI